MSDSTVAARALRRLQRLVQVMPPPEAAHEVTSKLARALQEFWSDAHTAQPSLDGFNSWHHHDPRLNAVLWQHPIGQGLFHSGIIHLQGRAPFRYVYDCGKLPSRDWERVLLPMAVEYGRHPLDALFISHFDNDHINGLTELLRIFGGAKRAFLPYLSPLRRLMIGIRDSERGSPLDDGHKGLLDDPSSWLTSRGVEQVIFVGGPDGPGGDGDATPEPPEPLFGGDIDVRRAEA